MIQRIQSLYLLLVAASAAVMLFEPLAWLTTDIGELRFYAFSLRLTDGELMQPTEYLGVLVLITALLPLVTIGYFRRRLRQLRLCAVEAVLLLGVFVIEGVYYYLYCQVFEDFLFLRHGLCIASALPLVGLLFVGLAARAIWHDELLVRDADRIR